MKKYIKHLGIISGACMLLVGCTQTRMMQDSHKMSEAHMKDNMSSSGEMAPNFKLVDTKGKEHSLDAYKGKKVLVKVWASWCSICLSSMQETDELAKNEKDFVILTIVAPNYHNEKSKDEFIKWYDGLAYKNLTVLLDENGAYLEKLGIIGYPTELFIASDGTLVKQQPGYMSTNDIQHLMKTIQ